MKVPRIIVPGEIALRAANSICNYCLTRFPTDYPPCELIDRPWFAEKVQKAIDEAVAAALAEHDRQT